MNLKATLNVLQSMLYFVMFVSLKHASVSAERTLDKNNKNGENTCNDFFLNQMNTCMNPFAKNANFYITTKPKNAVVYQIFIKYVCRRYEKMLLCVHTVLSNCPSVKNIQIVQNRLSNSWALDTNQLCNIRSNPIYTDTNKTKHYDGTEETTNDHKVDATKGSLQTDYNGLLLPPNRDNDKNSKQFQSETISRTQSSNDGHKTIPLLSTEDNKDYKIVENLNDIEDDYKVLQSGQSEIMTTEIKYKSQPRNRLSWVLTQSVRIPSKSNIKFIKKFHQHRNMPHLLELIHISVIGNSDLNHMPNIAQNTLEQTYFQTASAAKSVILQRHMSWHMMLFLALWNILFCLYRTDLW